MSAPVSTTSGSRGKVRDLLGAVRALSDALDRMHGGMKDDMGLNATDLAALRMLIVREQRGEAVTPHAMAHHLRISSASTTKLLDRLGAAGHIERLPHPSDRRARVVQLTDLSRREFFSHFGAHLSAMRAVAERYTDDELELVTRVVGELGEALDPR